MADYVFKVKLLLADLGYPAFYYRQSICADKLNCCFQDLRNELMRRYDLRPSLDVKGHFKLQWYYDGDMITILNNEDLNIFMELKGTRLVVVRTQMARSLNGFNLEFNPQFKPNYPTTTALNYDDDVTFEEVDGVSNGSSSGILNTQTKPKLTYFWPHHQSNPLIYKPSLTANSASEEISKTVELSHQCNPSFVDATVSNSASCTDVSHVKNDQPKHTAKADSSTISVSVSVNASFHFGNDQSNNTSPIPNVPELSVTSPIPNLRTAVADVHVEDDQLESTGNVSLPDDTSSIVDTVSANAGNVGDDQPKITNADQEIIPQMGSSMTDLRIADVEGSQFKPIENVSLLNDSSLILISTADVVKRVMHIEDDKPEDASVVQKIVPQIISPISDLRAIDDVVNVENDQSKHMGNVSLVRDSSSILDLTSVNVNFLDEDDQTTNIIAIQKIVPPIISPISDLRAVDPDVNVENDQHTSTIRKTIVGERNEPLHNKMFPFEVPGDATVSSSITSNILTHEEIMAKVENMLQCRSKHPQLPQPLINFSIPPPQLPTPELELSAQAPEILAQAPELSTQAPELLAQTPELLTYTPELPTPVPVIPRLEKLVHYRFEGPLQPPLYPLNISVSPPKLPTPVPQLTEPTKHPNPRVQAALTTMTSQMKFSNSGGWLERLLEAVDGDIDKALRKLQPKMH